MKYDKAFFDAGIERKHTRCVKWDAGFIGPDDLPMWVADWDFACPEPIVQALRQRAAVCLRTGGGGGLYACATMLDFIKGE